MCRTSKNRSFKHSSIRIVAATSFYSVAGGTRNHYGTVSEESISPADYFALMIEMFTRGVWERNIRQDFWRDIEAQAALMNRVSTGTV